MDKETIIRKLTSRKLWTAVASFVALLIVAAGHTESEAAQMRSGKRECWTCSAKKTDRDCCRNRILTETELIEAGKWAVGTDQNFEMEYYCKVERADIYRDRIIFTFREGDKRIWQRK